MQSQIRTVRQLVPKDVLTLEEQLEKDEVGFQGLERKLEEDEVNALINQLGKQGDSQEEGGEEIQPNRKQERTPKRKNEKNVNTEVSPSKEAKATKHGPPGVKYTKQRKPIE